MADKYSISKRRQIMSQIGRKDTKPEILVRKFLFAQGFRFRKNDPRFPGRPDIVLPKYRTIIFVHGCFWHGHENCPRAKLPGTRNKFWSKKIDDNIQRDQNNISALTSCGWRVIIIWQCEINTIDKRASRLNKLALEII